MRWFTNTVSIALAIIILSLYLVEEVSANAVFELELKKFVNHYGMDSDGNCCSGFKYSDGKCSDTCLTKFRVCLNVYQEVINPNSHCTFGEKVTPVLGTNEVNFSLVKNFVNPLEFKLDSWQGTFSLIIEAWHDVSNGTLYYDGPVLLTRLMKQEWLDVGFDWTEGEHKSSQASLQYKYRVVCQEHYHGSACRKWCRPRNDSFGHYTCNEDGNLVCLDGWQNPESYCSVAVCSPGCKGNCAQPNECKCAPGWQGEKCDTCILYPGCLHGTCEEPWKCNCKEGWGGLFCNQDLNYCTNHKPCKNGATCFNTAPGSYSCDCAPGFNGTNCEIVNDSCANDPCKNGGTCLDTDNDGFVCQCKPSFTGRYCELSGQTCSDRPCRNNAPCTDTPSGFMCHCPEGYEGMTCERSVNDCVSSPCLNGGSCVDEHKTFRCVCPIGYSGQRCQVNVDDCSHKPCLHDGKCIDGIEEYKCQCKPGFVGHLCEINVDDCGTTPCANGGSCIDGINDFQCKCRPGWSGKFCNEKVPLTVFPCASNPCDNGGACKEAPELSVGYRCICPVGMLGPRCTVPHHHSLTQSSTVENDVNMSPVQIVLIVTFSVAVPVLVVVSVIVIACMKRRRRREMMHHDEEARRQNEQNAVHNAVNNKNLTKGMIFNSLDYPAKPINAVPQIHQKTNQQYQKDPSTISDFPSKKNVALENTYSIIPTRSTKTLNTDVSRLSLASRLEKDLDGYTANRNSPAGSLDPGISISKTPDPYIGLPRTQSHSEVYVKRPNHSVNNLNSSKCVPDVCVSTHTLTSTCTPSTCTTPSSVYVIEEHVDENYIATEV